MTNSHTMGVLNTSKLQFMLCCFISVYYGCYAAPNVNSNQGLLNFWVLTDLHIDQNYSTKGSPEHFCHESGNSSVNSVAGYFGDYKCEAPMTLLESTLDAMQTFHPNPDFILWLGDDYRHDNFNVNNSSSSTVHKQLAKLLIEIRKRFKKLPIFPAIGNHDNLPSQLMPEKNQSFYRRYLTDSNWKTLIRTADMQKTFLKGGYYSTVIKPGLKLIVLNTILWLRANKLSKELDDPAQQMQWLAEELKQSNKTNQKVLITAHAPSGYFERQYLNYKPTPYFYPKFNDKFIDIVLQYSDIITIQLYTHTHSNSFRIFTNNGKPVSSAIISSSISPNFGINPTVKYFSMNSSSYQLEKYVLYFMNLTNANRLYKYNQTKDARTLWKMMCDTSLPGSGIDLPDLSVTSLAKLFNNLLSNNKTFDKYKQYNLGGAPVAFNSVNYIQNACAIKYNKVKDFENCKKKLKGQKNRTAIYEELRIDLGDEHEHIHKVKHQPKDKNGSHVPGASIAIGVCSALVAVGLIIFFVRKGIKSHFFLRIKNRVF